jgi:hypothetical protein
MSSLLKKLRKFCEKLNKNDEVPRSYEIVRVSTNIPSTRMFVLVATNKPKI